MEIVCAFCPRGAIEKAHGKCSCWFICTAPLFAETQNPTKIGTKKRRDYLGHGQRQSFQRLRCNGRSPQGQAVLVPGAKKKRVATWSAESLTSAIPVLFLSRSPTALFTLSAPLTLPRRLRLDFTVDHRGEHRRLDARGHDVEGLVGSPLIPSITQLSWVHL